jgi:hypothetical protein
MRAELKNFFSSDVNIESYWPEDEKNFGFWVSALIGPHNQPGTEIFQILICTPDWLKEHHTKDKFIWGRNMLIVFSYDIDEIKKFIQQYMENCTAEDWPSLARKISKIGAWEFEEYKP